MHFPKLQRRPELDALRGLFLVWMTLTHMPTRLSDWVNQPFGYLSSAEGFVFLSALLVARISIRQAAEDPGAIRRKLWKRSFKIYCIHLTMLALAFTVVAAFASHTHRDALNNLLHFYETRPRTAAISSLLLFYCPPLLDILPMYVLFLLGTPLVLAWVARHGWRVPWIASLSLWLGAQFGLREWLDAHLVRLTHLQVPVNETGAFNLLAWQAVWMAGLWLGASSAAGHNPLRRVNAAVAMTALLVCLVFLGIRHDWLGHAMSDQTLAWWLDKWHVAPLRVVNLLAFIALFYWLRRFVFPVVQMEPFLTLGKASLEVFCAHLVFVFLALALVYNDVAELHGTTAILSLIVTFVGLFVMASLLVKRRTEAQSSRTAPTPPAVDPAEGLGGAPATKVVQGKAQPAPPLLFRKPQAAEPSYVASDKP